MKSFVWLVACVFSVIVIAAWQNRDATIYAPGFTEARFRTIRVGMPKADVLRILGAPVSIDPALGYINWTYPKDHGCPDEPFGVPAQRTFSAGLDGKITEVYGDCDGPDGKPHGMIGHSLNDVRKQFGPPREILEVPDRDYYWYSKMQGFKGQYIRRIVIYNTGIVGSVDAGRIGHYIEVDGVQPLPSSWIEWLEWNF
jgi:hypothetical protein